MRRSGEARATTVAMTVRPDFSYEWESERASRQKSLPL